MEIIVFCESPKLLLLIGKNPTDLGDSLHKELILKIRDFVIHCIQKI